MPNWNPAQYLRFEDERTRPCHDLANRIALAAPSRIVDLGCGPGNSTRVLAARWPDASITGLDSSAGMIAAARAAHPSYKWEQSEIGDWSAGAAPAFDLVFSNAALQWVGDHAAIFPRLFARVASGGALAVQMPSRYESPAHRVTRELAASDEWRDHFRDVADWHSHDITFYYDLLAPLAGRTDFWVTEYLHVLAGPEGIVEWYKGTGLRPYLNSLDTPMLRDRFLAQYLDGIRAAYPRRADGRVAFPFRRIFLIAYREERPK